MKRDDIPALKRQLVELVVARVRGWSQAHALLEREAVGPPMAQVRDAPLIGAAKAGRMRLSARSTLLQHRR